MTSAIIVEAGVWSSDFCQALRTAMDAGDADAAEIIDAGTQVDLAVRRAFDVTLSPAWTRRVDEAVARLRGRVSARIGLPLSRSVGATCLRYPPGGMYLRHRDRDPRADHETGMRLVSMIVWLNTGATPTDRGDFDGGLLRIFPDEGEAAEFVPTAGTLVAFPAGWAHEVTPVARGARDAVVDWFY